MSALCQQFGLFLMQHNGRYMVSSRHLKIGYKNKCLIGYSLYFVLAIVILIMKKAQQLMNECISRNLHCSITHQIINNFSVEIYRGYESNYEKVFYTDGHIKSKKAIKKALKFISNCGYRNAICLLILCL